MFTAEQIAQQINATIDGNPDTVVYSFNRIEEAKTGDLSFLANPKYENFLYTTQASLVIIHKDYVLKESITPTLLRVQDPYTAFAQLLKIYQDYTQKNLS